MGLGMVGALPRGWVSDLRNRIFRSDILKNGSYLGSGSGLRVLSGSDLVFLDGRIYVTSPGSTTLLFKERKMIYCRRLGLNHF